MYKFDTHIHTKYSPCSNLEIKDILDLAEEHDLHTIFVRDHNTCDGTLRAAELSRRYNVNVVRSLEAKTQFGEISIDYLTVKNCYELMKIKKKDAFDFIKLSEKRNELKENNKELIVGLMHPYSGGIRGGFDFEALYKTGYLYSYTGIINFFDYTEINGACMKVEENKKAIELAKKFDLSVVYGSDSHFKSQIGKLYSMTKTEDIRQAIVDKKVINPDVSDINYKSSIIYRIKSSIIKAIPLLK